MMSPHGETVAKGTEHVRTVVVIFMRNSAIGTLVLRALSAWLLFPAAAPEMAGARLGADRLIAVLVGEQPLPRSSGSDRRSLAERRAPRSGT